LRSARSSSAVTSDDLVVRSALTPGGPGAAPPAAPTSGAGEGGGHRDQRDAPLVGVEETRRARGSAMLADAGVHDAGLVERTAGLAHALEPPVGRVVVRPRHDVEADRLEVLRDAGRADDPDAAELRLRDRGRSREVDRGAFEVAERRVGVVKNLADGGEPRRLRHRPRDDAVADRPDGEAVADAHRQLALRVARRRRLLREHGRAADHEKESGQ
jgi:hypothetical protein